MTSPIRMWLDVGTLATSPDTTQVFPLYHINLGDHSPDPDPATATATAATDLATLPTAHRGIKLSHIVEDVFVDGGTFIPIDAETVLENFKANNGYFIAPNVVSRLNTVASGLSGVPLGMVFTNCEVGPAWYGLDPSYMKVFWSDPFVLSLMPVWMQSLSWDAADHFLTAGAYGHYCMTVMSQWLTSQVQRSVYKLLYDAKIIALAQNPQQVWVNSPSYGFYKSLNPDSYLDSCPLDNNGWPMGLGDIRSLNCIQAYSSTDGGTIGAYPDRERPWRAFMNDMRTAKLLPNCIPEVWIGTQNTSLLQLTLAHSLRMFKSTIKYRDILFFDPNNLTSTVGHTMDYVNTQAAAAHSTPDRASIIDISSDTITTGDLTSTIADYIP